MGISVLRPDDPLRVSSVQGHWGQDPVASLPPANAVPLVPVAPYGYDPVATLWLPQPVIAVGPIIAALLPDNRMLPGTYNLGVLRAAVSTGLSGRNLNVLGLSGAAQIQLVNAGGTYALTDIYPADRFNFDFTDVLLTNGIQPGKTLTLMASWRV
jgi:hypothetical protein